MKRIYYIFFLATLLFSCEKPISEFQSQNFIKFFGSGYESKGNDVIELAEGGFVITGYDKNSTQDNQIFVAKADKNGNLVWSKTFGKTGMKEEGKLVKEVSDGFLIAGTSSLGSAGGITHSFIFKTNANGDSLWYKEFGDPSYSIVVNDIIVGSSNIFVAGQSNKTDVNKTDFYRAKLDLTGEFINGKSSFIASNSFYKRIFIQQGDNLLLVGTYGNDNVVSLVTLNQSTMNEINPFNTAIADESAADASFNGDQLYLLVNKGQSSTKLSKLNPSLTEEWHYESTGSIVGKSVAYNEDGTLLLCGESIDNEGKSVINFIHVNPDGSLYNDEQFFRTFQGTVGRIIQTKDKGLILVGTTNSTYGANIQLIKTDKDYFMLKK